MSDAAVAYAQLFALGVPWVALHCGAMCGPIAIGMTATIPGKLDRLRGIGVYQLGRAVVYLPLGAAAGAFGRATEPHPHLGAVVGLTMAAAMVAAAWGRRRAGAEIVPARSLVRGFGNRGGVGASLRAAQRLLAHGTVFPLAFAGVALGALPCMLPAWVLGLAARSGSAAHGAALMALLLAMSALPLGAAALLLPGRARSKLGAIVPRVALAVSAIWFALGALATLHVLPHGRAALFGVTITFW
jgi:sulfite exporter TauE/SafE